MNDYRQYISIILFLSAAVLILTGVLILFHLEGRLVMHLHKYASIIFMLTAIPHIWLNGKALRAYLKKRPLLLPLLVGLCLILLGLTAWDMLGHHGYGYGHGRGFFRH